MDTFFSGIRATDFVSVTINPTLNGSHRVKSFIGGLLSILIGLCIAFGFGYFTLRIIRRDNPMMNYTQVKSTEATVSLAESPLIISVYDKVGRRVNNNSEFARSIKMTARVGKVRIYSDKGYSLEYFEGPLKNCSKEHMNSSIFDHLTEVGFEPQLMLCPDPKSMLNDNGEPLSAPISIFNEYPNTNIDFLSFRIRLCDEEQDPGCRDYFKAEGYLNVMVQTNNYYVDPNDFEDPVKVDFQSTSTYISAEFNQVRFLLNKINNLITDRSLFLSETSKLTYYSISRTESNLAGYDPKDRTILSVICSVDQLINTSERKYLKIPEMLAIMGGFVKGIVIISQLMIRVYSQYDMYLQVESIKLSLKPRPDHAISSASIIAHNRRTDASKVPTVLKKKEEPKLSFWDFTFSQFPCCGSSNRKFSKKDYYQYLDLKYLIKTLSFIEEQKKASTSNLN